MSKFPFIEIYVLEPSTQDLVKWPAHLLLYEGKPIGTSSIKSFSYKYAVKGDDKLTILFVFNKLDINLEHFKPGTTYRVRWGYVGGPSVSQVSVVDDNIIRYSKLGLSITVKGLPPASYKAKHPLFGASLKSALADVNLTVTIKGWDPYKKRVVKTYIDVKKHIVRTNPLSPTAPSPSLSSVSAFKKASLETGLFMDFKTKFKVKVDPLATVSGKKPYTPGSLTMRAGMGLRTKDGVAPPRTLEEVLDMTGDQFNQAIGDRFAAWLTKIGVFAEVGTRDDHLELNTAMKDRPPLRTFTPHNIRTLVGKALSKGVTADYNAVTSINPIEKKIHSSEIQGAVGKMVIKDVGAKPIVLQVYQKADQLYARSGDKLFKLSQEQVKQFSIAKENSIQDKKLRDKATEEFLQRYRDYQSGMGKGDPLFGLIRDKRSYAQLSFIHGFNPGNLYKSVQVSVNGYDSYNGDRAVKAQMDELYTKWSSAITIEGDPDLSDDFNFLLLGFPNLTNGLYFSMDITHSITRNGYITTILGAKFPPEISLLSKEVTQSQSKIISKILAKFHIDEVASAALNIDKDSSIYLNPGKGGSFNIKYSIKSPADTTTGTSWDPNFGVSFKPIEVVDSVASRQVQLDQFNSSLLNSIKEP